MVQAQTAALDPLGIISKRGIGTTCTWREMSGGKKASKDEAYIFFHKLFPEMGFKAPGSHDTPE